VIDDRDTTRIVRSWLEVGATSLPDRVLDGVLDQLPATTPGTYVSTPFARPGSAEGALCLIPAHAGCEETTADDAITFTFTVPDGWVGVEDDLAARTWGPPGGAGLMFLRGAWLFSDPCADAPVPDIAAVRPSMTSSPRSWSIRCSR
jgi:hypothetical protein